MHMTYWGFIFGVLVCAAMFVNRVNAQGTVFFRRSFQRVDVSPKRRDTLLQDVKVLLEMDDAQIRALITDKATFLVGPCPVCRYGVQPQSLTIWSIEDPFRITCSHCGTTFPNEQYRETAEWVVSNPLGEQQVYHYYPGKDGEQFFFTDTTRHRLKGYLEEGAEKLGILYQITKAPLYAHKAAVILSRFADVYRGIPVHSDVGNDSFRKMFIEEPPYLPHQSMKWERWRGDCIPMGLVKAYDLIVEGGAFEQLSEQSGRDEHRHVEVDLLREGLRWLRVMGVLEEENKAYAMGAWGDVLGLARALGDAPLFHEAIRGFRGSVYASFFFDGMDHRGTPGYHVGAVRTPQYVAGFARGYTDPPGYLDSVDGERFDDLDIDAFLEPFLGRAGAAVAQFVFSDGRVAAVHDSWSTMEAARYGLSVPTEARPQLLNGYGHAILGHGKDRHQMQAHLHFGYLTGHGHADMLNVLLFAKGKEVLPDLGYTHGMLRAFTAGTLGHNTVLIDEKGQHFRRDGHVFGNLLLYDVTTPVAQVVEAEGIRAYDREIADLNVYRRMLILVPVSDEEAYVVDIFRVKGGSVHDWVMHAGADTMQEIIASVPLQPRPGTLRGPNTKYADTKKWSDEVRENRDSDYGLVDNLQVGATQKTWTATVREEGDEVSLRVHMLGGNRREILLGDAPSPRAANRDYTLSDSAKSRILLVRSRAHESVFAVVWEPFKGEPFITTVAPLPLQGDGAVGLEVRIGQRRDRILVTYDGPPYPLRQAGDVMLQGRVGMVSEQGGQAHFVYLLDGTRLTYRDKTLTGKGTWTGNILRVRREAKGEESGFETDALLPEGDALRGRMLLVTHPDGTTHGYVIVRVEQHGAGSLVVVVGEPGFAIASRNVAVNEPTLLETVTRFPYFPQRVLYGGENRLRVSERVLWMGGRTHSRF